MKGWVTDHLLTSAATETRSHLGDEVNSVVTRNVTDHLLIPRPQGRLLTAMRDRPPRDIRSHRREAVDSLLMSNVTIHPLTGGGYFFNGLLGSRHD